MFGVLLITCRVRFGLRIHSGAEEAR
jgi:hypothetical protein